MKYIPKRIHNNENNVEEVCMEKNTIMIEPRKIPNIEEIVFLLLDSELSVSISDFES